MSLKYQQKTRKVNEDNDGRVKLYLPHKRGITEMILILKDLI